ncbi:probable LRR receptor-like serine/threonine-protein kinase At1g34110 [Abrus precatorius]|uniref:Probable LRR receptor-like serine/threonine-protein kinase At1g34110 n=1 Tax=Abrus precatorius TaxID=3816 RepID=A0A8B8MCE9_ABRPR|nr:probable LRR receptor-like serine/threonine-protein kinase At1g34110 [Abrus precatorius]
MQNLNLLCLTIIYLSLFPFHTSNSIVQALTLASDIAALKAFKASIKPSSITPWSCLASWNFTTDPCSLPRRTHFICGLTCNPDYTRINQITLDPAGYSATLTPLISQLTQLVTLDLADNSFFGPIPSSISSLSNLQTFTLRSNSFTGSIPPSITNLKSLQSLDLSQNSLSGSLPNSFNSLTSIRRIDLSFNKLTGSIPKLPPNLLELAIKTNSLSGPLQKQDFEGLNQLEVVELSENALTGTVESWFFLLPSLQQVNLANNSFTGVQISRPAGGGSNLVALNLGFNRIQGYAPANLAAYPILSFLSIRHNSLRGTIPLEYGKIKSMKRLFLDGNYLVGKPPSELFAAGTTVSGSLGDNCLQGCPMSSQLCTPAQKPTSVCKQAYRGRPKP